MSLVRRVPLSLAVIVLLGSLVLGAFAPAVLGQGAPSSAAQVDSAETGCRAPAAPFLRTELFFGSSMPGGGVVSEQQFMAFLDQEITPRFPDGLTLMTGLGQFRGSNGVIQRERSMQLILLYPRNTARASSAKIDQIRTLYEHQFNQESVLRADERLAQCVSF